MADSTIKVDINMPQILNKVQNDKFGKFLITEWTRLMQPYTPHREGTLERNIEFKPFEATYTQPYAHYMYTGKVYVDPIYKVGGFTNNGGETWFSRPGVKKEPSEKGFNYRTKPNPFATDHWDVAAKEAGQVEKLVQAAENYLIKNS